MPRYIYFSFLERKLGSKECPHHLYTQNYSSAASSCIVLRKWIFDVDLEIELCHKDSLFYDYCFWQAVRDVNVDLVHAGEKMYELKAMQDVKRKDEVGLD